MKLLAMGDPDAGPWVEVGSLVAFRYSAQSRYTGTAVVLGGWPVQGHWSEGDSSQMRTQMSPSGFWEGSVVARRSRCSGGGEVRTTRRPVREVASRAGVGWRSGGAVRETRRERMVSGE